MNSNFIKRKTLLYCRLGEMFKHYATCS